MPFEGLTEKLSAAFKKLRGKGRLTENDVREAMREVRLALLEALSPLLASCGLCTSRGDARKMVQQGAVLVADQKVTDVDYRIDASQIGPDGLMLRKGKKNYCRLILK